MIPTDQRVCLICGEEYHNGKQEDICTPCFNRIVTESNNLRSFFDLLLIMLKFIILVVIIFYFCVEKN